MRWGEDMSMRGISAVQKQLTVYKKTYFFEDPSVFRTLML